jgi:hypothetical protein
VHINRYFMPRPSAKDIHGQGRSGTCGEWWWHWLAQGRIVVEKRVEDGWKCEGCQ